MKHAAAQASITAAGRALQAFAALNVDAAGRAAAEIARASLTNVDAATQKCFASVTERAIADDGVVPKPARILANLVTLASPENVDALGRRFVDTLGDAAEALHDQNKRVNHFARSVAHSGLFPALQLLTTHDSVSWSVFVDALAQMLSFVQFTLPDVDRNDLNSTSYLLDVTAFLERSRMSGGVPRSSRAWPRWPRSIPHLRMDRWSSGTPGLYCATLLSSRPRRRQRRGSLCILPLTFY